MHIHICIYIYIYIHTHREICINIYIHVYEFLKTSISEPISRCTEYWSSFESWLLWSSSSSGALNKVKKDAFMGEKSQQTL